MNFRTSDDEREYYEWCEWNCYSADVEEEYNPKDDLILNLIFNANAWNNYVDNVESTYESMKKES